MLVEQLFDKETFQHELASTVSALSVLRRHYRRGKDLLKTAYEKNVDVEKLLQAHTYLIDQLVTHAWRIQNLPQQQSLCLVATGGYGREELHPFSDLDVLIVGSEELLQTHHEKISAFVTLLWDIKLKIGQVVASFDQALQLATQDVIIATNLLDSRLLLGDEQCFDQFKQRLFPNTIWTGERFLLAKLDEQKHRYQKYGNSSYNLEPNIKQGPGGLRDLQLVFWIAKQHFASNNKNDLVSYGFLTKEEYYTLIHGQRYLWQIRTALHYLAGRQEERLLFDYQVELADKFIHQQLSKKKKTERLMKTYYRTVKSLNELKDLLLQFFHEVILQNISDATIKEINPRFRLVNNHIEVSNPQVFKEESSSLLEIFLLMAKDESIAGVRAQTIRLLRNHRYLIDEDFRNNKRNRQLFISLFRQQGNVALQLRNMNRYGIIGKYLPCFFELIGQMQYDLFHVYTVDRHLIATVQNIYRFTLAEKKSEFPLCHQIVGNSVKREILYLAALFHDIGKGQGGDHSLIGEQIAKDFCQAHRVLEEDQTLITWLVKHHLLMSQTAQQKDIYDPDVLREFAEEVKSLLALNALYALTVTDICATNENLWNSWKDCLLKDLYRNCREYLQTKNHQKFEMAEIIAHNRRQAKQLLQAQQIDLAMIENLWDQWNKRYFLHHTAERITWHTQEIMNQTTEKPLVLVSPYLNQGGTEIFIHTKNVLYLFAKAAVILDRLQLNIVDAQILTTENDFTLDSIIVLDKQGRAISSEADMQQIQKILDNALEKTHYQPSIAKRLLSRRLRHFSQTTQVEYSTDNRRNCSKLKLITPDRAGLLARIGNAFVECKVHLLHAKIATLGDLVEDVFYITNSQNKLLCEEDEQQLTACLTKHLKS